MGKRKSTIRKMRGRPVSRKFYHLLAELESITRKLERFGQELEETEFEAKAERAREGSR